MHGRIRRHRRRPGARGDTTNLVLALGCATGYRRHGLLVGYVAEPLLGRGLGELLGGAGISTGIGIAICAVLAVAFSTVVQMVFL